MSAAAARRSAIDNLNVPVLVVGADGVVGYANASAHRVLGEAPGALQGVPLSDLLAASQQEELAHVFATFAAGATCRLHSQAVRNDGRVLDVALTVEPSYADDGQVHAYVVSLTPLPPWEAKRKSGESHVGALKR